MNAEHPYVEERNGTYYVRGQRVRLASFVYEWHNGIDVESIAKSFPIVHLAEVMGALAFYLEHQVELDLHFAQLDEQDRALEISLKANRSEHAKQLHARLEAMRKLRESTACGFLP